LRERAERHAFDQRIFGDSEFVQEVTSGLDDKIKRNLRVSGQCIDIDTFAYTLIERKLRMPQIQGVQGRSRNNLQRALGNEGDGVSSAFPKGKQRGRNKLFL